MTKEVMKQALEALKNTTPLGFNMETDKKFYSAIEALEEALKKDQDEPLEYWNAVEGWVKLDEVREHFDSVSCATIYKNGGEGRVPLCLAQSKQEQDDSVSYIKEVIEALYENSDPVSVEAGELLERIVANQEQGEPWLLNYAKNLAKFMAKNFYPEVTHWKVSDDLVGVILQIDNMVTGLIRKSRQEQGEPETLNYTVSVECKRCGSHEKYDLEVDYPPPQQRKPLKDKQIDEIYYNSNLNIDDQYNQMYEFVKAIELAHGIKE